MTPRRAHTNTTRIIKEKQKRNANKTEKKKDPPLRPRLLLRPPSSPTCDSAYAFDKRATKIASILDRDCILFGDFRTIPTLTGAPFHVNCSRVDSPAQLQCIPFFEFISSGQLPWRTKSRDQKNEDSNPKRINRIARHSWDLTLGQELCQRGVWPWKVATRSH